MKWLCRVLLLGAFVPATIAQRQSFTADPNASEVKITLKTNHEVVNGQFHLQSGTVEWDPSSHQMSGLMVVAAGSGRTGNDSRDKRMNKEILRVSEHARVSFAPRSYQGTIASTGDSSLQVTGTFTLLDTPHEITVPMVVHVENGQVMAKAHFQIPYVQWGLKDPSLFIWRAYKDVVIDLVLVGHLSPAAG